MFMVSHALHRGIKHGILHVIYMRKMMDRGYAWETLVRRVGKRNIRAKTIGGTPRWSYLETAL